MMEARVTVRDILSRHFEVSNGASRFAAMEGMRGFAALIVFFVHFDALFNAYSTPGSLSTQLSALAAAIGHTGVDIFFVLSGILIYGILMRRPITIGTFIWRRIERLYPTFIVVFVTYVLVAILAPGYTNRLPSAGDALLWYLLANLLMLPGVLEIVPLITVAWSLSYELFFYVLICLTVVALGLKRWKPRWRVSFFVAVAVLRLSLVGTPYDWHPRMTMFVAGILIWEMVNSLEWKPSTSRVVEFAVALFFVACLTYIGLDGSELIDDVTPLSFPRRSIAPLFITSLFLTFHALYGRGFINALFSWRYLRWLGNMSYSFYLIHGFSLHLFRLLISPLLRPDSLHGLTHAAVVCVAMVFAVVSGAVLFLLVEKPFSLGSQVASGTAANRARI